MTLIGHIGPGLFLATWGLFIHAQACRCRLLMAPRTVYMIKFYGAMAFVVPAATIELAQNFGATHMPNLHHFTLYAIGMFDGLLNLAMAKGFPVPVPLGGVYEAAMLGCFGILFQAHNTGAAMFVGFHKFMTPLLWIGALLVFLLAMSYAAHAESRAGTRYIPNQAVQFMLALAMLVSGQWFMNIGFGYYLYGNKGGLYGTKSGLPLAGSSSKDASFQMLPLARSTDSEPFLHRPVRPSPLDSTEV
eukprot:TRINITY_DN4931_c0_g1_i2.p1 TRINITY_DN4931_c0_g1~~TRINITY_DN4931_c0_g1_i2.p1  ORF type:complete len:246 (-),score=61.40 TRINITY_DN4931_c0_g1_i2:445-1182(-)